MSSSTYRYKALDGNQRVVEGDVPAASERDAFEAVHRLGLFPIEAVSGKSHGTKWSWNLTFGAPVRPREIVLMAKQIASLLAAEIELERVLSIVSDLTEGKKASAAIAEVRNAVVGGSTLADALEERMPNLPVYVVSMVRAGEWGGTLSETFEKLSEILQRQQQAREKIAAQLIYPALLMITAVLSMGLLIVVVLPSFAPIFADAGQELPLSMAILMWIGDIFAEHGLEIGIASGLVILIANRAATTPAGRSALDKWLMHTPGIGAIWLRLDIANFARTLGMLLASGVSVVVALGVSRNTASNRALRTILSGFETQVREGSSLTRALEQAPLLPPLAAQLVRVGEESGNLDGLLLHAADIFEQDAERRIQRFVALLTPTLTIVLGVGVATIMSSILVAILSVNDIAI